MFKKIINNNINVYNNVKTPYHVHVKISEKIEIIWNVKCDDGSNYKIKKTGGIGAKHVGIDLSR